MSEKADRAQEEYDHNVATVRRYKRIYNATIGRVAKTELNATTFDTQSVQTLEDLSPEDRLKIAIGLKLQAIFDKTGNKHVHKKAVLIAALEVLNDKADLSQLEAVKAQFPDYKKALLDSKTEQLVEEVIALKSPTSGMSHR